MTPFPPKEGGDDGLPSELQLTPLKAAALLNNPGQEPQFIPPRSLNGSAPSDPQSGNEAGRDQPGFTSSQLPPQASSESIAQKSAFVQQRRIGVIETQGSFGGDASESNPLQQGIPNSNATLSQSNGSGVQISSVDRNGQRRGLLVRIRKLYTNLIF